MLKALNHIAIVVPDLEAAIQRYRNDLGAKVSDARDLPEHGVTVAFVELDNTKVELLHPFGDNSPIASFLEKNPAGGMHHMCFEVGDISTAAATVADAGLRILGDGKPKTGAHGKPVVFLHPKDVFGTLVELEEV